MQLRVLETEAAVASAVADLVAERLNREPRLVLGLATGRTPIPLYRALVELHRAGEVSFAHATTFNLDEFLGSSTRGVGCYRAFMDRHLFSHIDLDPARINFLDCCATDVEAECQRYDHALAAAGGIGLQILGIGANGHIGFNEPGASLSAFTHRVRLTRETRKANAGLFGGRVERVPREALSMGMAGILTARTIVMVATGSAKARAVERMRHGAISTRFPASFLQLHADLEVFLDRAAAHQKHTKLPEGA
jgi:glucosamine-6-phosphate deaminase